MKCWVYDRDWLSCKHRKTDLCTAETFNERSLSNTFEQTNHWTATRGSSLFSSEVLAEWSSAWNCEEHWLKCWHPFYFFKDKKKWVTSHTFLPAYSQGTQPNWEVCLTEPEGKRKDKIVWGDKKKTRQEKRPKRAWQKTTRSRDKLG